MSRRPAWTPYGMPGMRRSYARHVEALADPAWWTGHPAAERMAEMSGRQARAARIADLYWVTLDMARVALDASTDVPDVHLADALPTRHGMMLFSGPLPPVPYTAPAGLSAAMARIVGEPVETDGLLWRHEGDVVVVNALARAERAGEATPVMGPLADGATTVIPATLTQVTDLDEGATRALAAFLHTVVTLMETPTVASVRDATAATGETRPSAPRDPIRDGDVRLVDLRPLRHVATEDTGSGTGRVYRHRWIVRGHWRQQAVGPKRGQRRTIWVPSYTKGPEGAPLLSRETVMVWRR